MGCEALTVMAPPMNAPPYYLDTESISDLVDFHQARYSMRMINPSPESAPAENSEIASVEVIRDLCIGAASCVALASDTFELDTEAKAVVKNPKGNSSAELLAAAQSCPVNAIILKDASGKQIWPEV